MNAERISPCGGGKQPHTMAEEWANVVTHGFGLVLSVVGALLMAWTVWQTDDPWRMIGCGVYLASLVAVFASSTLSHLPIPHWTRTKARFRALDQGFIYLLIVATYTPFSLAYLRTVPWWLLLGAVWAVALCSFFAKVLFAHRIDNVAIWPCFVLGWAPAVSVPALIQVVPITALWWMLAGGACYTVGTIFFLLDHKVRHFHAVWHLLVIAGSSCHFLAILLFVAR